MTTFRGRHPFTIWLIYPLAACFLAWCAGRFFTVGPGAEEHSERRQSGKSVKDADAWSLWREAQLEPEPIDRLVRSWAAAEVMNADQLARAFNEALNGNHLENIAALGERCALSQPDTLVETLLNAPGDVSFTHRDILDAAFRAWARRDSRAAFQRMSAQLSDQSSYLAGSLMESLAIRFLSDHPMELSTVLPEFEGGKNAHLFGRSPETFSGNVDALAKSLSELPSTGTRDRLAKALGNAILTEKPDKASNARFWKWWQALPPDMQQETVPSLDRSYQRYEVDADGEHLQPPLEVREHFAKLAMEDTDMVPAFMQHFGAEWADENAREALAWVLQRYEGRELTGVYSWPTGGSIFGIGGGEEARAYYGAVSVPVLALARQDPWQAVEALEEVPFLETRGRLAQDLAGEWARTEPQAALAWSQALPAEDVRRGAQRQAMVSWAKQDPDMATSFGLRAGSLKERQELISHVGNAVRQGGSAEEGAHWLVSLPDELMGSQLSGFIGQPPNAERVDAFKQALAKVPSDSGKRSILDLIDQRLEEADP